MVGPRPELWAEALAGAGVAPPRLLPDADVLPLAEGAHDLVVHGLALHWANDPVGQLVQARRALRPDGLFIAALFGGETLGELRAALAEAEIETLGGLSPRVAPMGEIRDLGGLLQRAGLALPVADSRRFDVSYATALDADARPARDGRDQRDARPPAPADPPRDAGPRRRDLRRRASAAADGRVRATFDVIFLTGWAPAPDQPKPLRPGSARRPPRRRARRRRSRAPASGRAIEAASDPD